MQGPSACNGSGSSQSNEPSRSDLSQSEQNTSEQTGFQKHTEKSNVSDGKTVTQPNGNIDHVGDSAENLFTWTQEQHRKKKTLIENGVTQSNSISGSRSDLGDNKTHGSDTVTKKSVTFSTEKSVVKQNGEKSNAVIEDKTGIPVGNKSAYEVGREIVNGRVIRHEDMTGEAVCDSIQKDTKNSCSNASLTGQTELRSGLYKKYL